MNIERIFRLARGLGAGQMQLRVHERDLCCEPSHQWAASLIHLGQMTGAAFGEGQASTPVGAIRDLEHCLDIKLTEVLIDLETKAEDAKRALQATSEDPRR